MRSPAVATTTLPGNTSPLEPSLIQVGKSRRLGTFYYADWNVARHRIQIGNGGPGGVRTLDLMTASHARSQLRHRPTSCVTTLVSILPYCTFSGKAGF